MPEMLTGRDPRLDVLRGVALVMIYVNHVPGTVWEMFTSRNFGFSDAAEAFVMMSGIAAGIAYSSGFARGEMATATRRVWRRAWTLYTVHILVTVLAVACAALFYKLGSPQLSTENLTQFLFTDPMGFMLGVPLLTHQLGYANILPLYTVLLLATPALIVAGLRAPKLLILGSVLLWAYAGHTRFNLPNYPVPGGWFFNPFAWQLIYVLGLMTGIRMKQGKRFVPVSDRLVFASAVVLFVSLVWSKDANVAAFLNQGRVALAQAGLPYWITEFEKNIVSLPRLLHFLALAYMISALPGLRAMCGKAGADWLAVMGRNGLQVFALGTVLCYLAQGVMDTWPNTPVLEAALIFCGIWLQWAFAMLFDRWKTPRPKAERAPAATARRLSNG